MASFFQKAKDRAQEAAAQFQQQHQSGGFTYTGGIPHYFRNEVVATYDPRYKHNRSFHKLSGKLHSVSIDHEALARETKQAATATYEWGQDHKPENREDSVGDDVLTDVTDRLAYVLSMVGDLHHEHGKRLEASRADFKAIQKLEAELAEGRQTRIRIHRELMTLIPERTKGNSAKVKPLEEQLDKSEKDDAAKEEELGKLKRQCLQSSYTAHFDSLIELGDKLALVAKYGKLLTSQIPIVEPPFPSKRVHKGEESWPGAPQIAAIRAAVEPAVKAHQSDKTLPPLPPVTAKLKDDDAASSDTLSYAESHAAELAESTKEDERADKMATDAALPSSSGLSTARRTSGDRQPSDPLSPLPEGGSLPPNLNMNPVLSPSSPPVLPPRTSGTQLSSHQENPFSEEEEADEGPTFAETGQPILSSDDPGPKTGTLSPRRKPAPPTTSSLAEAAVPPPPTSSAASSKEAEAMAERLANERAEVAAGAVQARLRRNGTVVRRGDSDWDQAQAEDLPPYAEEPL